jgi:uncharacterized membrane protein YGL010W
MRTVEQWFGEYGESHRNPRNEMLHIICVPPIVLTVIGFLWSIPVPALNPEIYFPPLSGNGSNFPVNITNQLYPCCIH